MAEQVFFDDNGVKVTSARLVFGQETFQLAGITSVRPQEIPPDRKWPIILMIAGLCTAFITTVIGAIWWAKQKPTYAVVLVSAGGESPAYISEDKNLIFQIANAVNEAMAAKG